jgi:hypothetical protein
MRIGRRGGARIGRCRCVSRRAFAHDAQRSQRWIDAPRSRAVAATSRLVAAVSFGGGGRATRLVCGYLNCSHRFAPLFDTLPAMLIVRAGDREGSLDAFGGDERAPASVPEESSAWLATTAPVGHLPLRRVAWDADGESAKADKSSRHTGPALRTGILNPLQRPFGRESRTLSTPIGYLSGGRRSSALVDSVKLIGTRVGL